MATNGGRRACRTTTGCRRCAPPPGSRLRWKGGGNRKIRKCCIPVTFRLHTGAQPRTGSVTPSEPKIHGKGRGMGASGPGRFRPFQRGNAPEDGVAEGRSLDGLFTVPGAYLHHQRSRRPRRRVALCAAGGGGPWWRRDVPSGIGSLNQRAVDGIQKNPEDRSTPPPAHLPGFFAVCWNRSATARRPRGFGGGGTGDGLEEVTAAVHVEPPEDRPHPPLPPVTPRPTTRRLCQRRRRGAVTRAS